MRLLALRTIVAASDLTATSDAAVRAAKDLACAAGSTLHVVHVSSDAVVSNVGRRSEAMRVLEQSLIRVGVNPAKAELHVVGGSAAEAIATLADRVDASVVVVGRRSDGNAGVSKHRPLGGTAYAVVTRSSVPCLAITDALRIPVRATLVATDCSKTARGALFAALSWTSALRGHGPESPIPQLTALHVESARELSLVHARAQQNLRDELAVLERSAGTWAGIAVKRVTLPGEDPADAIAAFADLQQSNIVFLGTRGVPDYVRHSLGSVAAAVTSRVSSPVLLVPPAVWRDYSHPLDYR